MTPHLELVRSKLVHLARMRSHLSYSVTQVRQFVPVVRWLALTADQHESLAAFRVRFSEYQEHLGKTMRAVAIEEEVDVDRFGSVLAFMERLQVLDDTDHWKLIRELRNAVNHDYEDDPGKLSTFIERMLAEVAALEGYHQRLSDFCRQTYGLAAN